MSDAAEYESDALGYPGIAASGPGQTLMPTGVGGIALHKMEAAGSIQASFAGEEYWYEPWFTALVRYRGSAVKAAVLHVEHGYEFGADDPSVCLMLMSWDRQEDIARSVAAYREGGDEGFRAYLARGPQIDISLLFATEAAFPELFATTREFVGAVSKGVGVTPVASEASRTDWERVVVTAVDEEVALTLDYLPWTSSCPVLEDRLPTWLEQMRDFAAQPGIQPDRRPVLEVDGSVAELIARPVKVADRRLVEGD